MGFDIGEGVFPFADGKGEVLNYLKTMTTRLEYTSRWSNADPTETNEEEAEE